MTTYRCDNCDLPTEEALLRETYLGGLLCPACLHFPCAECGDLPADQPDGYCTPCRRAIADEVLPFHEAHPARPR